MAKVPVYRTAGWQDSDRHYRIFGNVQGSEQVGDYYHSTELVRLTLYVDEETGIYVNDIDQFEMWIKKIEGEK